jgi:malonyl-ACP O-methyltransferase BioC
MSINKELIQQRFSRAAATYDREAAVQHRVADRLTTLLGQHIGLPPKRILEIGCCTGLLTRKLTTLYQGATLFANDLVPEFKTPVTEKTAAARGIVFLEGDIETLALPRDIDLVISSSTFHWLTDFPALVRRLSERITPEGTLAFSMYSAENLLELREITGVGLRYSSLRAIRECVAEHFHVLAGEEEHITYRFKTPLDLLQHLRRTGVNSLDTSAWNRSRLQSFSREYQARFGDGNHVRLTYHPVYLIARK